MYEKILNLLMACQWRFRRIPMNNVLENYSNWSLKKSTQLKLLLGMGVNKLLILRVCNIQLTCKKSRKDIFGAVESCLRCNKYKYRETVNAKVHIFFRFI